MEHEDPDQEHHKRRPNLGDCGTDGDIVADEVAHGLGVDLGVFRSAVGEHVRQKVALEDGADIGAELRPQAAREARQPAKAQDVRQDRDKSGEQKHRRQHYVGRRPQEIPSKGMAMQAQSAGQPVVPPDEPVDQGEILFAVCDRRVQCRPP